MSALYDKYRQAALEGSGSSFVNILTDNIKAVLVDNGLYTVDLANHQFLSDIAAGARISTSGNLASKTSTAGVFDAADITFTTVTGASIEDIVLYKDTGNAATSPLIAYIDSATGLPVTPSGGDILVTWDNGANKIFKL
jgi:hypothetical protein